MNQRLKTAKPVKCDGPNVSGRAFDYFQKLFSPLY